MGGQPIHCRMFGTKITISDYARKMVDVPNEEMEQICEELVLLKSFVMAILAPGVVVDALSILEGEFNNYYQGHCEEIEFEEDVKVILEAFNKESDQPTSNTFSLFVAAVLDGLIMNKSFCLIDDEEGKAQDLAQDIEAQFKQAREEEAQVKQAIQNSGLRLFKQVIEHTAFKNPENEALYAMRNLETSTALLEQLKSWSHCFYFLRQHTGLNAFDSFSDTASANTAKIALFALNYIVNEDDKLRDEGPYHSIIGLIESSIPFVEGTIGPSTRIVRENDIPSLLQQIESAKL